MVRHACGLLGDSDNGMFEADAYVLLRREIKILLPTATSS